MEMIEDMEKGIEFYPFQRIREHHLLLTHLSFDRNVKIVCIIGADSLNKLCLKFYGIDVEHNFLGCFSLMWIPMAWAKCVLPNPELP